MKAAIRQNLRRPIDFCPPLICKINLPGTRRATSDERSEAAMVDKTMRHTQDGDENLVATVALQFVAFILDSGFSASARKRMSQSEEL